MRYRPDKNREAERVDASQSLRSMRTYGDISNRARTETEDPIFAVDNERQEWITECLRQTRQDNPMKS
jgi:hypothetical protein